jgi:hypothetical protein
MEPRAVTPARVISICRKFEVEVPNDGQSNNMKSLPVIIAIWLVASCPSWAGDQETRFLEFPGGNDTTTYDLNTVQLIQPGRFTIVSTAIDNPDVMKFKLNVLDTLRTYCARADGKYPAPANIFTLGPPDMPVQSIDVGSNPTNLAKRILWFYPYRRLAVSMDRGLEQTFDVLSCKQGSEKEDMASWNMITNGTRQKILFDCKRGVTGYFFLHEKNEQPTLTGIVPKGTQVFEEYLSVCRAVTHEAPYLPE